MTPEQVKTLQDTCVCAAGPCRRDCDACSRGYCPGHKPKVAPCPPTVQ